MTPIKRHELTRRTFLALTGTACGAMALGPSAKSESGTEWPNHAAVSMRAGRPTLVVNGREAPPFAYMSYLGETQFYREVAEAGIHLYCFPAYLGDRGINTISEIGPFRDGIWIGEDAYDFGSIEKDFAEVLEADSEAQVVIRLHMDPPEWWEAAHPEACCLLPDGSTFRQCFSSTQWREATAKVLLHCLDWLQQSPYAKHLIGVHVAAGFTEEWFYHFRDTFHDENPARTEAFRDWLRRTYGDSVERLQTAWGDDAIGFETAHLADISGAERRHDWLEKHAHRHRYDSLCFHTETMVENIAYFCALVKAHSDRRLLTGAFYGYHYFVGDPRRGHGALRKLLACPDLDYLSSPNVYNRVLGEDWPPMVAVASVHRHGKLWLAENDTRTFKTTPLKERAPHISPPGFYEDGVWLGPDSVSDSVALLRKNAGRMLAHGYGGWWFDMWGGWFSDPELLAVLRRTQELGMTERDRRIDGMEPQVAVVVDETLAFQDGSFGELTEGILANRFALGKIGTSYELLLRGDMMAVDPARHRFVWLLGLPHLDPTESNRIAQWQEHGVHVLHTRLTDSTLRRPGQQPDRILDETIRFTPSELRTHLKEAGVHLYVDADDVVYAGNGWCCIHTEEGGDRTVHFPFPVTITDAFAQQNIAQDITQVELTLGPRSTTLLQVDRKADA